MQRPDLPCGGHPWIFNFQDDIQLLIMRIITSNGRPDGQTAKWTSVRPDGQMDGQTAKWTARWTARRPNGRPNGLKSDLPRLSDVPDFVRPAGPGLDGSGLPDRTGRPVVP